VLHNDLRNVIGYACHREGYVRRRGTVSRKPSKTQQRKPTGPKRSSASTAARRRGSSAADLEKQLDLRTRELNEAQTKLDLRTRELGEALEQQTATAEVLSVISSTPGELEPVFEAMLVNAVRICEAKFGTLYLREGDAFRAAALHNAPPAFVEFWQRGPHRPGPRTVLSRVLRTKEVVHISDITADQAYVERDPLFIAAAELGGFRTVLAVPMLKEADVLGAIYIYRQEVRPFSDKQIKLLSNFAAQAVIAIENARLFNETQEALEQQTATAEVLRVINASPGNLAPVFDAMIEEAIRLCDAVSGHFRTYDGNSFSLAAVRGAAEHVEAMRQSDPLVPGPHHPVSRFLRGENLIHIPNTKESEEYRTDARFRSLVDLGVLSLLSVSLRKDSVLLGYINVYRHAAKPFTNRQIALLQNFAAQAVVAMENARLLGELRQRTDELTEALVYQTGSSNILKVIASSPTDVGPALQAIVDSACEICDAPDAAVFLKDGHDLVFSAHHGSMPNPIGRWPINRNWVTGRAVMDKVPQQAHDLLGQSGDEFPEARNVVPGQVHRTVLSIPLLREGDAIGAISLRRMEAQPFSEKQIELLWSFADQAVISISNVRLFEQVQDRTRELSKSLDDLRDAQDRLIQTEKLAFLGQLTAGIAHEIKNPLNFVNNFSAVSVELTDELNDLLAQAELAGKLRQEVGELTSLLKDNLSKVVQHGKRADSIVKNMLLHSREGSGERRSADINALVGESLNLAYHGARAEKAGFSITLEQDFDPAVGAADIYPQEITRALLNLISNGFYAATRRKVEAGDETFEPVLSAATRNLGKTVEIRIRDNGTGIPPEVKERIFNPFFTTKPTGEGTGLGLSMTHDIVVKQHGGGIDVETEPGVFTEFIITLPRGNDTAAGYKPE
jgi:two-component system, NtrC family, sensor kinase